MVLMENKCDFEVELEIEIEMWHVCPLCKVGFVNKSELQTHTASVHPEISSNLIRSVYLKALLSREDGNIISSSSPDSSEIKNTKQKRRKFEGSYNYGAFECDLCLSKFSRKSYLDRHIRFHSEGKILSCEVCGMRFRKVHRYEKHRKSCFCLSSCQTMKEK